MNNEIGTLGSVPTVHGTSKIKTAERSPSSRRAARSADTRVTASEHDYVP